MPATLVLSDGAKSEHSAVTSGVPQGTVMWPLLFLLHINDMPSVVDLGMFVCLFADDTLIYRVIHSIEDQVVLQWDAGIWLDWNNWPVPGAWCSMHPSVSHHSH